jgi:hypothetical protein
LHNVILPESETGEMEVVIRSKSRILVSLEEEHRPQMSLEGLDVDSIPVGAEKSERKGPERLLVLQVSKGGSVDVVVLEILAVHMLLREIGCDEIRIVVQAHVMGIRLQGRVHLELTAEEATHHEVAVRPAKGWSSIDFLSRKVYAMKLGDVRKLLPIRIGIVLVKDEKVYGWKETSRNPNGPGKNGSARRLGWVVIGVERPRRCKIDDTPPH